MCRKDIRYLNLVHVSGTIENRCKSLSYVFNGRSLFQVQNATDTTNFDDYPDDDEEPPDDLTGWDKDF